MRVRPGRVALVGLLLVLLLVGARWWVGDRSWTHFVVLGAPEPTRSDAPLPPELRDLQDGDHYDGIFYLRLAKDPLGRAPVSWGLPFDEGPYRQQRILYPVLGYLLALGESRYAALGLVLVNVIALSGLVFVWGILARDHGLSPAWGLAVFALPGLPMALGRSTAEALAALALSSAFLALERRRSLLLAAALSLAVLTREDTMVMVAALAGVLALASPQTRRMRPAWVLAAPLLVFTTWQGWLWRGWGEIPATAGTARLGWPLRGLADGMAALGQQPLHESAVQGIYFVWHVLLAVEAARAMAASPTKADDSRPSGLLLRWATAGGALWLLLAILLSGAVWSDEWAFSRVLVAPSLCAGVILLVRGRLPGRPFQALTGLVFLATVTRLILRP